MMRHNLRSRVPGLALFGLALFLGGTGCQTTQTPTPPASTTTAAPSFEAAPPAAPTLRSDFPPAYAVPYYPPPSQIDLCGEPVPLHNQDVAERFDKEFTLVVYNNAQVYLWLKRMERYFPWIEERLRSYNLPDDLKYVAIVESDLLPNACSPKGAAGPWQFMPKTGSSYGMDVQGSYDERFDFERATDGAFRYMQDLNKRYKNWALAIACYNCGDKRILEQAKSQRTSDYYQMKLPIETERYVFRILAIKAVLSNPAQYGYSMPKGQGYPQLKADRLTVTFSRPTSVQTIASAAGTTFREIKRLNPTLRADEAPVGTYEIRLPKGTARVFQQNFDAAKIRLAADQPRAVEEKPTYVEQPSEPPEAQAPPEEVKPVERSAKPPEKKVEPPKKQAEPPKKQPESASATTYTVKKGDTLSTIAQRNKVTVEELKKLNHLKDSDLDLGQKLRIR